MLTRADLPLRKGRWVPSRKAILVAALRGGLISAEEAYRRYALSTEEILSWQAHLDRYGLQGLRTSKYKQYR